MAGFYERPVLTRTLGIEGLLVRDSPPAGSLCCVFEQGSVLVQSRKMRNRPDMTENVLTRT